MITVRSITLSASAIARRSVSTTSQVLNKVNSLHEPDTHSPPVLVPKDNSTGTASDRHWTGGESWGKDEIQAAAADHCVFTWGATDAMRDSAPILTRGEGIYLHDIDGNKYMDWTSQAMCTNIGYDGKWCARFTKGRHVCVNDGQRLCLLFATS